MDDEYEEETLLDDEDVQVGSRVRVIRAGRYSRAVDGVAELGPEEELEVTRISGNVLTVRTVERRASTNHWDSSRRQISFAIGRELLTWWVPRDPSRPRPRRLGEKPEDTPEMTYIDVHDPRIQWLFEDMGKYADKQGYCSQYDALTARLGIPGRPREFKVAVQVGDVSFNATVTARSKREANEKAHEALKSGLAGATVSSQDDED